jgi:integrating conjugative element membrane protein (TIGR03745 family)
MKVSMIAKRFNGRLLGWMALALLAVLALPEAHAALPAAASPTGVAAGTTNWLDWVQGAAKQGVILIGLLIGAVGLIMVVSKVISQYHEVGNGRATWGDVATSATGGAIVMMLATVVLTLAIAVFP